MSRDYGRVDVDIVAHVRADYDLPDLIRRHRKEYAALPVKTLGYQEWERRVIAQLQDCGRPVVYRPKPNDRAARLAKPSA